MEADPAPPGHKPISCPPMNPAQSAVSEFPVAPAALAESGPRRRFVQTLLGAVAGLGAAITTRRGDAAQAATGSSAAKAGGAKRFVTHEYFAGASDLPADVYGDLGYMRKGTANMFGGRESHHARADRFGR
jgi:hypothetical protein